MKNFDFSGLDLKKLEDKYLSLIEIIRKCGSALIAFSGGVDSSYLAFAAKSVLDDKLILATAVSETFPSYEMRVAENFARLVGIKQILFNSSELDIEEFKKNSRERCYYCKKELFKKLILKAAELGINKVFSGANFDDRDDFRPGLAAQDELGVVSPLLEAGLTKLEIRYLSKKAGLNSWNRPQMACLTSRFPYGVKLDRNKFKAVELCEDYLRELGFSQYRVRVHDELARIEIEPAEFDNIIINRDKIAIFFKNCGFKFVSVDIEGFRSGSFN